MTPGIARGVRVGSWRRRAIKGIGNRSASCDTGRMEWCLSVVVWFVFDLGRGPSRAQHALLALVRMQSSAAHDRGCPVSKPRNQAREDAQQHQRDRPHKQHDAHSENTENGAVRVHPTVELQ